MTGLAEMAKIQESKVLPAWLAEYLNATGKELEDVKNKSLWAVRAGAPRRPHYICFHTYLCILIYSYISIYRLKG